MRLSNKIATLANLHKGNFSMPSTPADLRARVYSILSPLLPNGSQVALFDFPNHGNVGDSAIWLGERAFLKRIGARIVHCDDCYTDTHSLPELSKDVIVLIHGGGNFGNLYPRHQKARERIIAFYTENRIIQLPQSVYFNSISAERDCWSIINEHSDFHLLVRDNESAERARAHSMHTVYLCPDMAFCLTALPRAIAKKHGILGLLRTDKEGRDLKQQPARAFDQVDWLEEPAWIARTTGLIFKLHRRGRAKTTYAGRIIYDQAATHRVSRGCRLLSSAELVITDRLHAHILCTLLEIPHVVIDNSYGKLTSFQKAWDYNSSQLFQNASTLTEALSIADAMTRASN